MSHHADGWDHYLSSIEENAASPELKKQLTEAVQTIRRYLGEDWPSKAPEDSRHAILWELRMISGAVRDYLPVVWGNSLSAVEGAEGLDGMLAKLRRHEDPESSIAELEMAGRLVSHGYSIEFEPEVERKKKPDMLCRNDDMKFFVEVKTLGTAAETSKANMTIDGIRAACRPIFPLGAIFKPLSGPHLKEVADILARKTKHAIFNNIAVEVSLDKVLKVYIVPDELPDRDKVIREWRSQQEMAGVIPPGTGGLYGPPDNVREEHRVRVKINDLAKTRQIPPEATGVLVITGPFLFQVADGAEHFVDYIIEDLYEQENIPAVVLVADKIFSGNDGSSITDRRDFIFIRNQIHNMIQENVVVVKNRFCKPKFDYENLKSLLHTDGTLST